MRMRIARIGTIVALGGAALLAGGAHGAMPEDAFEAWRGDLMEARTALIQSKENARPADVVPLYNEYMDKIEVVDLSPSQLLALADLSLLDYSGWGEGGRDYTDEAMEVVERHVGEPTAQGAIAAIVKARLAITPETTAEQDAAAVRAALEHPGLREALESGELTSLNSMLAYQVQEPVREMLTEEYASYLETLSTTSPEMLSGVDALYERTQSAMGEGAIEALESARKSLIALAEKGIERAEAGDAEHMASKGMYASVKERLEQAPRLARLVGSEAPALTFLWNSGEGELSGLEDLRGKVVVLDFWATWCGPCVASFPNVRKLTEHYEGYPVEVVGVTSPQGATWFKDDRGKVDAADNAEEFEQMQAYMEDMDVTWTVVFTEENVFNPDYGIRGIPHLAILAPDGTLRYRGMHPANPLEEKTEKIDGLLEEFDLPTPAAPESD